MTSPRPSRRETTETLREARLWIDGVGCWLVWLPESLTIGGPQPLDRTQPVADLALLADLKRQHATIGRSGEQYHLTAMGPVALNGHAVAAGANGDTNAGGIRHDLKAGDELTLGGDVRWQFTIPTPLSNTARLICTSGHRPTERIDGVILLEQFCQLGPQPDHHIVCPRAEAPLILFRKGGQLWCRSPQEWTLDGRSIAGSAALLAGAVAATETLSFRLEVR
jgi:hypothetical protein